MAESTAIEQVNLSQELSENATSVYCSVQGGDRKTKALIYNAANNPEHKVADFINKTIMVKDILVEMIELPKTNGSDDPDPQPGKNTYPANITVETNSTYHQIRFTWDSVSGADRYGIAVYLAGKWRIQTQSLTSTSYTSPKNMTPGKTYKVAVAARVNGTWDVAGAVKNAVTVTVR